VRGSQVLEFRVTPGRGPRPRVKHRGVCIHDLVEVTTAAARARHPPKGRWTGRPSWL